MGPPVAGKAPCFEDQYVSTGGQLYELMAGHDRFIADLRPLMRAAARDARAAASAVLSSVRSVHDASSPRSWASGSPAPTGDALDAPFDLDADVSWVGYANDRLRARSSPRCSARCAGAGSLPIDPIDREPTCAYARSRSSTADGDLRWFASAIERIRALSGASDPSLRASSQRTGPSRSRARRAGSTSWAASPTTADRSCCSCRSPCATFAMAQATERSHRLDVAVASRRSSRCASAMTLDELIDGRAARRRTRSRAGSRATRAIGGRRTWSACVHACLTLRHGVARVATDSGCSSTSDVPEGKGVSSSAALEVACLAAIAARYGVDDGRRRARDGVPVGGEPHRRCAVRDHGPDDVARAAGTTGCCGCAVSRRCVEGHVDVPAGYRFYGIDCGIRHAVTRLGLRHGAHRGVHGLSHHRRPRRATGDDRRQRACACRTTAGRGYLANITPSEFASRLRRSAARAHARARSSWRVTAGSRTP